MADWVNYFPNNGWCRCKRNSSTNCKKCRALDDKQYDWGVFVWRSDAMYSRGTALRIFPTRAKADAAVNRQPFEEDQNAVVRQLRKGHA